MLLKIFNSIRFWRSQQNPCKYYEYRINESTILIFRDQQFYFCLRVLRTHECVIIILIEFIELFTARAIKKKQKPLCYYVLLCTFGIVFL